MNSIIRWPDQSLPVEIYCAQSVLQDLETFAADGLLAMPRTGLGIGGLLLGKRANHRIEILRLVEIPCSHALGPAFILTADEIAAASELPAREAEDDGGCDRVGWYWSKPNGQFTVTAYERSLFETLGPKRWQVALLIRPSLSKVTIASFGIRESEGEKAGIRFGVPHELIWKEPETSEPTAAAEPELAEPVKPLAPLQKIAPLQPIAPPQPVSPPAPKVVPPPVAPVPVTAPPKTAPVVPVAMPMRGTLFAAPPVARRRWPLVAACAAAALLLLWLIAFLGRSYWLPRPVIAMVAASDRAGRVNFLWNPDGFFWKPEAFWWNPAVLWNPKAIWNSGALNPEDSAVLMIDDGAGALHIVHLNEAGLRGGWYRYEGRPGKVSAVLKAGKLSDNVSVMARGDTHLTERGTSK